MMRKTPHHCVSIRFICRALFAGGCLLAAACGGAAAEEMSWTAELPALEELPPHLIVVDKAKQKLQVIDTFTCTSGQKDGPKRVEGDLRTPEGIYFVGEKIPQKLPMGDYGGIGYALNYPNPIDRLRGQTGYGIWIHSRGRPITPRESRGCVAVNLDDMQRLIPHLAPGTPVLLGGSVRSALPSVSRMEHAAAAENESAQTAPVQEQGSGSVEERTRDWNAAWAARSPEFFDFYDAEAYEKAQKQPFSVFKAARQREFADPSLRVAHGTIAALAGPGYQVSWFVQSIRTSDGKKEGIRRLYWILREHEWVVAGMEWVEQKKAPGRVQQTGGIAPGGGTR